jgi:ER membrane protein complex subunit 10
LEYDGWLNLELYHAIDKDNPEKFILRGNVTVSSLNTGAVSIVQETLSASQRLQLKELAENNR